MRYWQQPTRSLVTYPIAAGLHRIDISVRM
jgi:hypothetical protein